MRVLVATDAWAPQVNGVVRTLGELQRHGPSVGLELTFITPNDFRTMAMPGYPEIRLALSPETGLTQAIETFPGYDPAVVLLDIGMPKSSG